MHRARMTTHLRAPVFHRNKWITRDNLVEPQFPEPNVMECLVMWLLAAAEDEHLFWPLPLNMAEPDKPH